MPASLCPFDTLPSEIEDYILSFLWNSAPSLKNCALTTKRWSTRASALLYVAPKVRVTDHYLRKLISRLASKSVVASQTQAMTIVGRVMQDENSRVRPFINTSSALRLLSYLPHLETFTVIGFEWVQDRLPSIPPQIACNNLALTLTSIFLGTSRVDPLTIVPHLTNLRSLSIDGVKCTLSWSPSVSASSTVSVSKLSINFPLTVPSHVPQRWPTFSSVITARFMNVQWQTVVCVKQVILSNSSTIKVLALEFGWPNMLTTSLLWEQLPLHTCAVLECFSIEVPLFPNCAGYLNIVGYPAPIPPSLPANLTTYQIIFHCFNLSHLTLHREPKWVDAIDWRKLAQILPKSVIRLQIYLRLPLPYRFGQGRYRVLMARRIRDLLPPTFPKDRVQCRIIF